ncbi:MAG: MBL fold metallo-hydrolase [Crocinitomicaceae bacterium]|nr:MBL fold metallo-hydrolase [Crocinitomicaceae bacterium]
MGLSVQKFTFNPFQENTYVVHDATDCVIIDPGCYERHEQEELVSFISENNLTPKAVLLTHAHLDHVFGCDFILKQYNIDCYLHEEDLLTLSMGERSAQMYGIPGYIPPPQPNKLLRGGETLTFGSMEFDVKFTPGHCVGHVVFYNAENSFVINGDVLFYGSYGRYDLPGGDLATLKHSITSELFNLPDDTVVYCGHGPETTIGQEKRSNPILQS